MASNKTAASTTSHGRDVVVVLDNGGSTIKVGFAGKSKPVAVVPNCTAKCKGEKRLYVADEVLTMRDISSLSVRRPVDRVRVPFLF